MLVCWIFERWKNLLSKIYRKNFWKNIWNDSRTSAIIIIINHFTNIIIIIIICKNNFAICNVLINFTKDAINKWTYEARHSTIKSSCIERKRERERFVSKLLVTLNNLLDRAFRCITSYLDYERSTLLCHDVNLIEVINEGYIKVEHLFHSNFSSFFREIRSFSSR